MHTVILAPVSVAIWMVATSSVGVVMGMVMYRVLLTWIHDTRHTLATRFMMALVCILVAIGLTTMLSYGFFIELH